MRESACDSLEGFLACDLSTVERAAFEVHLSTCDECRRSVEAQQRLDALLCRLEKLAGDRMPLRGERLNIPRANNLGYVAVLRHASPSKT